MSGKDGEQGINEAERALLAKIKERKKARAAAKKNKIKERMEEDGEGGLGDLLLSSSSGSEKSGHWAMSVSSAAAEKRRQEAADMAKALTTKVKAASNGDSLDGMKVNHDVEEFVEGREVVLTLKDRSVLDSDGEDELENAQLVEAQVAKRNKKRKEKKIGYDVMNEKNNLLAQYDEEEPEFTGFRIPQGGSLDAVQLAAKRKREEALTQNGGNEAEHAMGGLEKKRKTYDLSSLGSSAEQPAVSDFAQVAFKAKKKKKKKKKTSSQPVSFSLPEPSRPDGQSHGSRDSGANKGYLEVHRAARESKFSGAVARAQQAAAAALEAEEALESRMFAEQERARLAALQQTSERASIAEELKQRRVEPAQPVPGQERNTVVLNATSEFLGGLANVDRGMIKAENEESEEEEKGDGGGLMDVDGGRAASNEQAEPEEDAHVFAETEASGGIAGALDVIRRRGLMQQVTQADTKSQDPHERFEELCHAFHGHGASLGKQAKKLQKKMERDRFARMMQEQQGTGNMQRLRDEQQSSGKAFTVIN